MSDSIEENGKYLKDDPEESLILSPEASHRVAKIIKDMRARFLINGKELAKIFLYQFYEIIEWVTIPEEEQIISKADLKSILYSPNMEKKEIRRIMAIIVHNTSKALEKSESLAREHKKKLSSKK